MIFILKVACFQPMNLSERRCPGFKCPSDYELGGRISGGPDFSISQSAL